MRMATVTRGIGLGKMKLKTGSRWHCMARLTHAGIIRIHVIFICRFYGGKLNGSPVDTHITLYQPHIGCSAITQINMGTMAIRALNILAATVVGKLSGMAICTDIYSVCRCSFPVCTKQRTV